MRRAWLIFAAFFLCFTVESAATAQTKIEDALVEAYRSNPEIHAQRDALRAQDEAMPQALSGWLPSAQFDASIGRNRIQRQNSGFLGPTNDELLTTQRTARVRINQPVYQGGGTLAATRRAENSILAVRAKLTATEQDVLLKAATAFLDVVRDQAILDLNRGNEAVLKRQMQATTDQFEVGEVTKADMYQARARYSRAVADTVRAEGNLETTRATYLNIVGVEAGVLTKPESLGGLPQSLEEALLIADRHNPRITEALHTETAARSQVDEAVADLLPEMNLRGEVNYNQGTPRRDSRSHDLQVMADFRLPIYQSGRAMSRIREAKYKRSQSRQEIERIRRDVAAQAKAAWQGLTSARARILALGEEIGANIIALDGVRQEASVGARTVLDILDAEQELHNSRVALVRAERDELIANFRLQTAMGRFTAPDLALETEIYDPVKHYDNVKYKFWGQNTDNED